MGAWGCANAERDFSSMLRPSGTYGVSGASKSIITIFKLGWGTVCWNKDIFWESRSNKELGVWLSDFDGILSQLSNNRDVWKYS